MNRPYKLFKLSILTLSLSALSHSAQAAGEMQQAELEQIRVTAKNRSLRTENRNDYTTSAMSSTTGLALTPRETPQSVSVITKNQLTIKVLLRLQMR
nr:hypothetical protein [Neisseria lactamica]